MEFKKKENSLFVYKKGEMLCIEPWGEDGLRVRATMLPKMPERAWALTEKIEEKDASIEFYEKSYFNPYGPEGKSRFASIKNGHIKAEVNDGSIISFYKDEKLILREDYRCYGGTISEESRCLKTVNREWKGIIGGSEYKLKVRFESNKDEKIFGMGQYQQNVFNLKGCMLELAQRNSQISVPFAVSSLGYGFLWNNPAIGRATFASNVTEWSAESTDICDYYICTGDSPKEILKKYTAVTGRAPMYPENLMGLWQCKLRYRTQEEVLEVARRYKKEGIKLDRIVIDFFHWTVQGEWKFDKKYWPDPKAMIDELHEMGTEVIVSVWPSVDRRSEHFYQMLDEGMLIRAERGEAETYDFMGDCVEIDPFNPRTCEYLWDICKKNYYDLGVDGFWLDNSEPDLGVYDFDNYRYYVGPALTCSNMYPQYFSRIFYDRMEKTSDKMPVNLLRACWAGSQKYGNVIWSGDIPSTFTSFRDQVMAGLNIGLAGIPWWTSDIGGFMTDNAEDPEFKELLIRWYQFAVYSAVLRMHGDRGPYDIPNLDDKETGGGCMRTGRPNELWSYGEENYRIMRRYYDIRIELHDYIKRLYEEASENGSPLIRAMFYEFPNDEKCWELSDQYMFGSRYLVAPVFEMGLKKRDVYLPKGKWKLTSTNEIYDGEKNVTVDCPIEYMPVFEKI